jgi:hypothetical protein
MDLWRCTVWANSLLVMWHSRCRTSNSALTSSGSSLTLPRFGIGNESARCSAGPTGGLGVVGFQIMARQARHSKTLPLSGFAIWRFQEPSPPRFPHHSTNASPWTRVGRKARASPWWQSPSPPF